MEKPTTIWESYLQKAIHELGVGPLSDTESSRSRATVYHDCAVFAEQQYQAILKSPDAIRWRVYVERKRQEVEELSKELASTSDQDEQRRLKRQHGKANKLLQEDSEQFRKHNTDRDRFLRQAMEMFARSLEVADIFDDDAPIRFCSLWFANFDGGEDLQNTIDVSLSRVPSYKMIFLAVKFSMDTDDSILIIALSINLLPDFPCRSAICQRVKKTYKKWCCACVENILFTVHTSFIACFPIPNA